MNRRIELGIGLAGLILILVLSGCVGQVGGTPAASETQGSVTPGGPGAFQPTGQVPSESTTSSAVNVARQGVVTDLQGNVHVLGETQNNSGSTAEGVVLKVIAVGEDGVSLLRAESGETIGEARFAPLTPRIADGQNAPFDYMLPPGSLTPSVFDITVESFQDSSAQLLPMQAENTQLMIGAQGEAVLVGELVNPNPTSASIQALAGVLADKNGAMLSASGESVGVGVLLPAGDTRLLDRAPFKIRFTSDLLSDALWQLFVDAEPVSKVDETQFAIDQAAIYYEDSQGNGHLVSSIKNPGEQSFSVQILAGLYGDTGVVMDVSALSLPIDLQPGQEIPFDAHGFPLIDGHGDLQAKLANYTLQVDPSRTLVSNQVWQELKAEGATQSQSDGGVWTFSGSVTNNLGANLARIVVIGTLNDHLTGKVVAVSTAVLSNPAGVIEPTMRMDYAFDVLADPNETAQLDPAVSVYALID